MNAQKRKSRPFEGMIRKAVVIVPSDEDYKARIEAQEKADSKEVPDNGVMEMKGTESQLFVDKKSILRIFREIFFFIEKKV